jgi:hypothetical protein
MGVGMLAGPLGWIVAGVSATVVAAIAGWHALERGAAGVSDQRRRALGLGVSYGSLSAYDLNFSRFGMGEGTLEAVASGVYDFTSPAYTRLRAAGATGKPTDEAAIALIRSIPQIMKGVADGQVENTARSRGLEEILDLPTIIRLRNHPEEIEGQIKYYEDDRKAFNMPKDAQERWASFDTTIKRAGLDIETVLGKNLVALAPGLTSLSDSFVHIIDAFIDSGFITKSLNKVEVGLSWFTGAIGSSEFKKGSKDFVDALAALEPFGAKLAFIAKLDYRLLSFGDEVLNGLLAAAQGNGVALRTWLAKKFGADFLTGGISGLHTGSDASSPALTGTGAPSIRYGTGRGQSHAPSAVIDSPTSWNKSVGDIPADVLAKVQAANPNLTPRQCVELVQSTMGVGNVHGWRRGTGEKDSPEGSALATFGNNGDSPYYAYGGSGTSGIGRDHALILVKKYPDGSFDAVSQDAGHAPHLIHMPFTGRGGEGDAGSYFRINNKFGRPAGNNGGLFGHPAVKNGALPSQPISPTPPHNPGVPGWDDPKHGFGYDTSDPINPSFIPSWERGFFREGVFLPYPKHPGTPTPARSADDASSADDAAFNETVEERFAEMQRNRNAFIKRRSGHILDHMHSAPPPSIVVHDMTGGTVQVTVSRHEAAL